jgi:competence protein ComEC
MSDNHIKKRRWRQLGLIVLFVLALLSCALAFLFPGDASENWKKVFQFFGLGRFSDCADGSPLAVHILDVGKADSIFIECNGHYMLVDGGTVDRGKQVSSYLKGRGVQSLDCVVNTHPDSDHIGGLKEIFERFRVSRYLSPSLPPALLPKSTEYLDVQAARKRANLKEEHPAAGTSFSVGPMRVSVLGPIAAGTNTNNNSIVLRLSFGETSFLLMGDAEKEEEMSLLASGVDLSATVLKIGHHGSDASSSEAFLRAVKPKYAVISVGDDSNNLPKVAVSKRLSDNGITVYRTDLNKTVIFLSDGKSVSVKTEE